MFSDYVMEFDIDVIDVKFFVCFKWWEWIWLNKGLDLSDIDLSFDFVDEVLDGEFDLVGD